MTPAIAFIGFGEAGQAIGCGLLAQGAKLLAYDILFDDAANDGRLEGELTVRKQLVVHATGRVSGKIRYARIKVEEGAELSGEISVLDRAPGAAPPKRTGLM